jgi:hypothetical protein
MTRFSLGVISFVAIVVGACNAHDAPRTPEETCVAACSERATRCSDDECKRGCNMSLDRIIEREYGNVVACVAKATGACDDPLWAKCATLIGVHADGGPPGPPPPPDD